MSASSATLHADARGRQAVVNAMTIDVEDYFQVSGFERHVPRSTWDSYESRVVRNTARLLAIFDHANVKATFFVLGWVAARHPGLVRDIAAAGHELGSHGFEHRLIYDQTPEEFREDLRRSLDAIQSAAGVAVPGYRAPSFSITARSRWALDIIRAEGFRYDASIFPIRHDRYGIPTAPRHFFRVEGAGEDFWECPSSTVQVGGTNLPVAGGGYFRLLPYAWTKWGMTRLNRIERRPAVFYLHPWEVDPGQPRIGASVLGRFRHYRNLDKTESRLTRLLADFSFAPLGDVLRSSADARAASVCPDQI